MVLPSQMVGEACKLAARLSAWLLDEQVPGLNFITLTASRATTEIYQLLGLGDRDRAVSAANGRVAPITA